MAMYKTCPRCGSNLDFGEKCDCENEDKQRSEVFLNHMKVNSKTGQFTFQWVNKEADYARKTVS